MAILRGWNNDGIEEPNDDWRYDEPPTNCIHECDKCGGLIDHSDYDGPCPFEEDDEMLCDACLEKAQSAEEEEAE